MVCINRRNRMQATVFEYGDCGLRIGTSDLPVECYEYDGSGFDPEVGLYLTQTRHYDATEGRWLIEDPIGYEPGDNL
jgi:RHS repeat-associated protein